MTIIEAVEIRKILDSRGNPTVEVDVHTQSGFGRAAAPSGASTGTYEVVAYPAKGIDFAIEQFRKYIAPKFEGCDVLNQRSLDKMLREIDGTTNFARIGGNISIATSMAFAKAAADALSIPLYQYLGGTFATYSFPRPLGNIIGGGKHAIGGTDIQEFLVISFGPSIKDSVFTNALVHKMVGKELKKKFPRTSIGRGDEGAWVVKIGNEDALRLLSKVCEKVQSDVGFEVLPGLDVAASEIYKNKRYCYKNKKLTRDKQMEFMERLVEDYNLYILEDPLHEDDYIGFAELTHRVGNKCLIVGDDLFVTNTRRIKKGIDMGAANAVLIKPNQIGTITDTYDAITMSHHAGYKTIISHRSGETEDRTISHLSVAFGCEIIKTGTVGGERSAKLNELIRIEEMMRSGESRYKFGGE